MPRRLIAFVAAFALAFAIAGCSSGGSSASSSASAASSSASSSASVSSSAASSETSSSSAGSSDGYEIENLRLVNKDGNAYIAGKLTNTGDEQRNIVVSWYADDKDGNGIGAAEFHADMIQPKATVDFEVPVENTVGEPVRYDEVKQIRSADGHVVDAG